MTRSPPHVAAVLNITPPNHLDRHGTLGAYTAAKARILKFQKQADLAILNRDDKGSWDLRDELHGDLISFGYKQPGKMNMAPTLKTETSCFRLPANV